MEVITKMENQITEIVNKKTDSIEVSKGMTGKYGFSVKVYGNLQEEGNKVFEQVKNFVDKLNAELPVTEK